MTTELKPCPWCWHNVIRDASERSMYQMVCMNCGVSGPREPTGEGARESWNELATVIK